MARPCCRAPRARRVRRAPRCCHRRRCLNNVTALLTHTRVDPSVDVGCTWLPLYHDMGLSFLLTGALTGADQWLAPTAAFSASPFRWLHWLSESRASMTAAPNFAYNVLGRYARRVSDVDLGALRFALNGGEPIDCDGFATFLTEMGRFGLDPRCRRPVLRAGRVHLCGHRPDTGHGSAIRRNHARRNRFRAQARDARRTDRGHAAATRALAPASGSTCPAARSARSRSVARR